MSEVPLYRGHHPRSVRTEVNTHLIAQSQTTSLFFFFTMSLKYEPSSEPLHVSHRSEEDLVFAASAIASRQGPAGTPSIDSSPSAARRKGVTVHCHVRWGDRPYHESRRCSRDTYPESYITKYTSIQRLRDQAWSRDQVEYCRITGEC